MVRSRNVIHVSLIHFYDFKIHLIHVDNYHFKSKKLIYNSLKKIWKNCVNVCRRENVSYIMKFSYYIRLIHVEYLMSKFHSLTQYNTLRICSKYGPFFDSIIFDFYYKSNSSFIDQIQQEPKGS